MTRVGRAWATGLAALAVAACGGGGGSSTDAGSGGPAPRPVDSDPTALAFTIDNAGRVAGYPLWATDAALRVGQLLGDDLTEVARRPRAEPSVACTSGGTLVRSWRDADGNGEASAGDTVTLRYTACARPPMADQVSGTLTVVLQRLDPAGGWTASVTIVERMEVVPPRVRPTEETPFLLWGSFELTRVVETLRFAIRLAGTGSDGMQLAVPFDPARPDRLSEFVIEKSLLWNEARVTLSARMRYSSDELGGSFDAATTAPIRAWFDALPALDTPQGAFEMRGRQGDLVRLSIVGSGTGTEDQLAVEFDQGGDGSIQGRGSATWFGARLSTDFLFADTTPGGAGRVVQQGTTAFVLRNLPELPGPVPVDAPLRLQFTRPPADAGWTWRLVERGRVTGAPTEGADVPIQVERNGALVTVRPLAPLRYSRRYELVVRTGDAPGGVERYFAVTGESFARDGAVLLGFGTANILDATPAFSGADNPFALLAGRQGWLAARPRAADAPPVTYRWTAVGGTPLLIQQPDAATTAVSLAPGSTGVGMARVRLTLTLASGEQDSELVDIRTVADTPADWVSSLRLPSPIPEFVFDWTAWFGPSVATLSATLRDGWLRLAVEETALRGALYPDWTLDVAAPAGQVLGVGRYLDAWSSLVPEAPAGAPRLEHSRRGVPFAPVGSTFEVLELVVAPDGSVLRLALDAWVSTTGGLTPTLVSIRLNSAVPPTGPP